MPYLTQDILDWAAASQPLAFHGEIKKQALRNGAFDLDLHMKIKTERASLQWQYDQDTTDADGILYGQGNYVYALCFPYIFEAMNAVGGGQVVVPGSGLGTVGRVDFIVSASSYLPTGTASYNLSDFIGREIDFIRGGISQSTVSSESSYITWDKSTAYLTISPALNEGELITIK